MLLHINKKLTMEKLNRLLHRKASFLTDPHCQCLGLGQSIRNRPSCTYNISSASVFMINQDVAMSRLNNFFISTLLGKIDNDRFGKQDTQKQLRSHTPDVGEPHI